MSSNKHSNYLNDLNINNIKTRLLQNIGLKQEDYEFYNIFVNDKDAIHVVIIDEINTLNVNIIKKDIIFLHGLTGTSMQYFRNFKKLSKYFRLIAMDLPGMGLSNRLGKVKQKEFDCLKAEEYFISRIKQALYKLNINKFTFIGHSFGGYIACLYAMSYPSNVESLILLSPVGISSHFIEYVSSKTEDIFQKVMYNLNKPPTYGYQVIGKFAKSFFESILSNKLKGFDEGDDSKTFEELMKNVFKLKPTSENLIYKFFNSSIQAYKPICYYFECFKDMKVDFIYGDSDWNPVQHAEEV